MLAERFEQGVAGRRLSPAEGGGRNEVRTRGRLSPAVEKSESELDAWQLILGSEGRMAA